MVILSFLQKYEMGQADFLSASQTHHFFLHTKFQKNPDHDSKVMIKTRLEKLLQNYQFAAPDNSTTNFPVGVVFFKKDSNDAINVPTCQNTLLDHAKASFNL
jgi:hypothetical protein